jgi:nitric oxide dioxygenase
MLSAKSIEVVKATLPVIGAAIGDITPVFYRRMFAAHPELGRDLFNRGNQAQGDQQRALAGAIAAYATLLVDETAPRPQELLARIAHKHASLGIREDQYPIVHEHLFAAIVEVLGDAVTPDIAAAWDEVYWQMAGDLIAIEKELYADAGVEPDHIWRTVVVRERTQQSPDTVSFVIVSPDGSQLPPARPGQYISVAVRLPDGARQIRQYSLTDTAQHTAWGITVKAIAPDVADDGTVIPAGQVSNFLHQNIFEGDELTVSPPFGDLVLDDTAEPLLLISAGIGSTPIIGILHYLAQTGSSRDVMVLHADRSPARHAHRQELKDLVNQLPAATLHRWYEDLGVRPAHGTLRPGLVDLEGIDLPSEAQAYLCGPIPFMESVRASLIKHDIPESHIHYEIFGPDKWLAGAAT